MRWLLRAVAVVAAAPIVYLLLALLLGLVPVNRDWVSTPPAAGGITVWLRTNGVHAELMLPAAEPYDWRTELPPAEVVDADRLSRLPALAWIAFGWGDRDFFVRTRDWADLRADTAALALLGLGPAAMYVDYVARPQDYRALRIDVSPAEYERLVAGLRAGFARNVAGRPVRIDDPGYFDTDAFYEGTGRYTFWLTCNEWIRRVLAGAGVRTAAWAPFDAALFWQLR